MAPSSSPPTSPWSRLTPDHLRRLTALWREAATMGWWAKITRRDVYIFRCPPRYLGFWNEGHLRWCCSLSAMRSTSKTTGWPCIDLYSAWYVTKICNCKGGFFLRGYKKLMWCWNGSGQLWILLWESPGFSFVRHLISAPAGTTIVAKCHGCDGYIRVSKRIVQLG